MTCSTVSESSLLGSTTMMVSERASDSRSPQSEAYSRQSDQSRQRISRNKEDDARLLEIGKQLGVSFHGDDALMIEALDDLEDRDELLAGHYDRGVDVGVQRIVYLLMFEDWMESFDSVLAERLWGDPDVDWDFIPSQGRAGGIIKLRILKSQLGSGLWAFLGDFNVVRDVSERRGVSLSQRSSECILFDNWITDMNLVDLPLTGRRYTYHHSDERIMRRIDRILLSEDWISLWPLVLVWALKRDISDHCPLMLKYFSCIKRPTPFKVNNFWFYHRDFIPLVAEIWRGMTISGRGAFVVKEKLKLLKLRLKDWSRHVFGNLNYRILKAVEGIDAFDCLAEERELSIDEAFDKRNLLSEFRIVSGYKENLMAQKARSGWLREGDTNSDRGNGSKVVQEKYGSFDSGRSSFANGSDWWRDLGRINFISGTESDWFLDGIKKVIGDGSSTKFWTNIWFGNSSLKLTFPRLFSITRNKDETVAHVRRLSAEGWSWSFSWRRVLFTWEGELLNSLVQYLPHLSLNVVKSDKWVWARDRNGCYSVKSVYLVVSTSLYLGGSVWEQQGELLNSLVQYLPHLSLNVAESEKWVWARDRNGCYSVKSAYLVVSTSLYLGGSVGEQQVQSQDVFLGHHNVVDGFDIDKSTILAVLAEGFVAVNITFRNTMRPTKLQASAVRNEAERSTFYRNTQFYRDCDIYGTVDFIFGDAIVILQNCNIYLRCSSSEQFNVISAQGRVDKQGSIDTSIQNSTMEGAYDLAPVIGNVKSYLGRP
ncbi:hypothetical protein RIF29_24323 [Crotalaria pallida]|uniref:Pectinesterase n=1 Tax=Crotalaria pallida TaxID=3830 RepID=A0AAN9EKD6_CROPI